MRRYIPDSPGLTRPSHMDELDWQEYMMTDEARHELTYVPDDDLYYDDDDGYYDAVAEESHEWYEEGRQGYRDGLGEDDNPKMGGQFGESWYNGWNDERMDYA